MRRHPVNRLTAVALLGLLLVASACGSGSSGGPAPGPLTAGSLTVALPTDSGPVNIFAGQTDQMAELVYDKLLAPSPYVDEPQPWLATAVRQVNPTRWDVDLRDDVTWHDGAAFTARDVAFTFHFMHDAPTGRFTHHVNDTPSVSTVDVVDDDSVRFVCDYPCPELGTVTLADLPIIPEHIWSTVEPTAAKTVTELPVGTGPFKLVEYSPTSGYRFAANAEYFAGKPLVDELVMPVIPDPSATFTALRSGEIDAAARPVPPELIDQFSAPGGELGVVKTSPLQFPELRMNFTRPPFDKPAFRTALSRAIDRDEMLAVVALEKGRVATKGYPHPDAPFANPDNSTPHSADQARTILDDIGLVDTNGDGIRENAGKPMSFTISADGALPTDIRAAEMVAEDLGQIGIGANVRGMDTGSLADLTTTRNFDMYVNTITAHGVADPTQFIMSHRSGYLWKAPDIPYPQWDALYQKWRAQTTNERRLSVLSEMQTLFNAQPTSIPLYYPDEYWAYRSDAFGGWVESPGYGIVHKWSFLSAQVGRDANAVATTE